MTRVPRRGLLALALALATGWSRAVSSDDGDDQALLADADYAAGLASLKSGDAAAALPRFYSALKRFPNAADLHNELGFAHRRLRQFNKAFKHYKRALAINPQHRGAHEYIGEAYLLVGNVQEAERHLAALRAICVLSCDELKDLERAIAAHRKKATLR